MFYIFLLLTIFISILILFILSRQDFVLLRQNISLPQIFDSLMATLVAALLFGRIFYIADTLNTDLVHIIRFFHLLKFPGISSLGFFLGGAFMLGILFRKKKALARIYDIFTISFLPLYILEQGVKDYSSLYINIILVSVLIVVFIFFVKSHYKYILRDGSISIILIFILCLENLFFLLFGQGGKGNLFLSLSFNELLSLPLALFSLIVLFLNQKKI